MATATTALTLHDHAKRMDPTGGIAQVVELMNTTNEVLDDMLFIEGNSTTGHLTTVRTGLPSTTWRILNYGVQPSKSTTRQVTDSYGMLEGYSKIDKALADINGNTAEFRLSEDMAFLESMGQTMSTTTWYGAVADSEQFVGFMPRYNEIDTDPDKSGINILDGGGTGSDNTSIMLVAWGPNTVHGIFPKGSKAGLSMQDLGEDTLIDAAGGEYQGYRTHYKWDLGLTVRNWKAVVRIANIDYSDLVADAGAQADLIDLMIDASEMLSAYVMGATPVFYMHWKIRAILRKQVKDANNVYLSIDEHAGKRVLFFDEIPVRRSDALLLTESRVV